MMQRPLTDEEVGLAPTAARPMSDEEVGLSEFTYARPDGSTGRGHQYRDAEGVLNIDMAPAPRTPGDPGPPKRGLDTAARMGEAGLRGAADGLLFGMSDEALAALRSVPYLAPGGDRFIDRFTSALQEEEGRSASDGRYFPKARLGSKIAGTVAGAFALPAVKAGGLGVRALTGAGFGGIYSGLTAAGEEKGGLSARLDAAQKGVLPGLAFGGALGAAFGPRAQSALDLVRDFERVGVDPVEAVVGGRGQQMVGQALAGNAVVGAPVRSAAQRVTQQTANAAEDIASRYGGSEGRFTSGQTLQKGVEAGAERMKTQAQSLYDAPAVKALESNPSRIPATNTRAAIDDAFSTFTTPEAQQWFARKAGALTDFRQLMDDTGGELSFAEIKRVRGVVGAMLNDPELINTGQQAALRKVYGALSDDLGAGAATLGGPKAAQDLARADAYWSALRTRTDDVLTRFTRADTPSAAYDRLVQMAGTKGAKSSWPQLAQLKRSMTPEEWGEVSAGLIRSLGGEGGDFSAATFATNWEKMTPEARRILFGGNGREAVFEDLEALARVARRQRDAGRLFNHSQSGNVMGNLSMLGSGGAIAASAGSGSLEPILAAAGAVGGLYGLSSLLATPGFARWAVRFSDQPNSKLATAALRSIAAKNPRAADQIETFTAALLRRSRENLPANLTTQTTGRQTAR